MVIYLEEKIVSPTVTGEKVRPPSPGQASPQILTYVNSKEMRILLFLFFHFESSKSAWKRLPNIEDLVIYDDDEPVNRRSSSVDNVIDIYADLFSKIDEIDLYLNWVLRFDKVF